MRKSTERTTRRKGRCIRADLLEPDEPDTSTEERRHAEEGEVVTQRFTRGIIGDACAHSSFNRSHKRLDESRVSERCWILLQGLLDQRLFGRIEGSTSYASAALVAFESTVRTSPSTYCT